MRLDATIKVIQPQDYESTIKLDKNSNPFTEAFDYDEWKNYEGTDGYIMSRLEHAQWMGIFQVDDHTKGDGIVGTGQGFEPWIKYDSFVEYLQNSKPKSKPKPKSEPNPKPKSKPNPKPKSEPKPKSKPPSLNLWKEKFEKEKEKRIKCEEALHLLEQRFTTLNMSMGKEILKKPFGPKGSKNKSSAKTQSKKVKN